jgi:hypothetical protein
MGEYSHSAHCRTFIPPGLRQERRCCTDEIAVRRRQALFVAMLTVFAAALDGGFGWLARISRRWVQRTYAVTTGFGGASGHGSR